MFFYSYRFFKSLKNSSILNLGFLLIRFTALRLNACTLIITLAFNAAHSQSTNATPTQTPNPTQVTPSLINSYTLNQETVFFPPEKNGVKILAPRITYSVDQEEDEGIILSDITFNQSTFHALSGKFKEFIKKNSLSMNENEPLLFITAPKALSSHTEIEILAESGKVIYSESIQKQQLLSGNQFAKELGSSYWNDINYLNQTNLLFNSNKFNELLLNDNKKSGFRFCWSKKEETFFSRYCTPYYRYSKKEKKIVIQTQVANTKVLIDVTELKPSGEVSLQVNESKRILLTSSLGFSIEFKSKALPLSLSHFFHENETQWIYFIGHSQPPVATETKLFPHLDPESIKAYFKWQPTIGDLKDYWITAVPKSRLYLSQLGVGGGIFRYELKIEKIPLMSTILTLTKPLKSTYSENPTLKGLLSKDLEVSGQAPSKTAVSKNLKNFSWKLNLPEKGTDNTNYLIIKEKQSEPQNSFIADYTLFRGYSGEFSLRLAGALSSDLKLNYLGEIAYNQWFESLMGWENRLLSFQRWGISAKHFKPLNSKDSALSIQLTTFDLKYRFTPGLWERDESWGLILGFEDVIINNIHGKFGGGGIFWARSMPKLFDDMMNWAPFMQYPKWVDMEMIYYFSPLTDEVKTGGTPTYLINFHGKVLWKKHFFGEAGFGLKAYSYYKPSTDDLVSVQAFYGTVGLGLNF